MKIFLIDDNDLFQTKIVDDNGQIVAVNTMGHLKVRGYSSLMYYMGDEEMTNKMKDKQRWIHTGYVYYTFYPVII